MKQRIWTAIIAIIIFVPIILYGGWPFIVATFIASTIALFELVRMYERSTNFLYVCLSVLFLLAFVYPFSDINIAGYIIEKFDIVLLLLIFLLLIIVLTKNKFTFSDAGFLMIATIFIGMAFYFVNIVRLSGLNYILFILFTIWATDTGAYFIGSFFGKRKLWPEISPNKTIGGAIGGIVSALIVGIIFHLVYPFNYSFIYIMIITIIISVFGQLGDLVASAIKRHYDIKDSGNIFPGHGGIIDRLDSFLFVVIILYFIPFI